jgi:hypothetical protein
MIRPDYAYLIIRRTRTTRDVFLAVRTVLVALGLVAWLIYCAQR